MTDRLCVLCGVRPSGTYLKCRKCRYALEPKAVCPTCAGPMHPASELCRKCRDLQVGPNHGCWRGGITRTEDGYAKEFAPGHPRANQGRYVLQHHLVMERMLGRNLLPGENVHHRNGVRDDNRPDNLELWVVSQPSGQRVEDVLAWAHEVVDRYLSEAIARTSAATAGSR